MAKKELTVPLNFRVIESMADKDKRRYVGEAFFLCPGIFGADHRNKFHSVMAYWLSWRIISRAVRDKFTSGGKEMQGDVKVKQIIDRAINHKAEIKEAAKAIGNETIEEYWKPWKISSSPVGEKARIATWLEIVEEEYMKNVDGEEAIKKLQDHLSVLRNAFV